MIDASNAFGEFLIPCLIGMAVVWSFIAGLGISARLYRRCVMAAMAGAMALHGGTEAKADSLPAGYERVIADFAGANSCTSVPENCRADQAIGLMGQRAEFCNAQNFSYPVGERNSTAGNNAKWAMARCLQTDDTEHQMGPEYPWNSDYGTCRRGEPVKRYAKQVVFQGNGAKTFWEYGYFYEGQTYRVVRSSDGALCATDTGGMGFAAIAYTTSPAGPVEDKTCQLPNSSSATSYSSWDYSDKSKVKSGDRLYNPSGKCVWFVGDCKPFTCKNGQTCRLKRVDGTIENLDQTCQLYTVTKSIKDGTDLTGAKAILGAAEIQQIVRDAWNTTPPTPLGTPDITSEAIIVNGPAPEPPVTKPPDLDPEMAPKKDLEVRTNHDENDCNSAYYHPGNRANDGSCVGAFKRDQPVAEKEGPKKDGSEAFCWKRSPETCTRGELSAVDPGTGQVVPVPVYEARNPNNPVKMPTTWCASCNAGQGSTTPTAPTTATGGTKAPEGGSEDKFGADDLYARKTTGTIGEAIKEGMESLKSISQGTAFSEAWNLEGTTQTKDLCVVFSLKAFGGGELKSCLPEKWVDTIYYLNMLLATWLAANFAVRRKEA